MSISALLDTSKRALTAQSTVIRTIGDNIANVNTPGYSRRRAELVTTPETLAGVGTGAEVARIVRVVDSFLNQELNLRVGDRSFVEIREELLSRVEASFSVDGQSSQIGLQLGEFFSALEDLTTNPASIPLRQQVIDKGEELARTISTTYDSVASLQREADRRLAVLVPEVNRLTTGIASLNEQIRRAEVDDQEALGLRDQRDALLKDLSELVSFQQVSNSDSTVSVFLSNGFPMVNGVQSSNLEFVQSPSFEPAGGYPPALDGGPLGHIVFNYSPSGARNDIDLTSVIRNQGRGEIAGLLSLRGVQSAADTSPFDTQGDLVEIAGRVEMIARDLLTRFNTTYLGPDADAGTAGFQPSATDLDGNPPDVFGLFNISGVAAPDAVADNLPTVADLNALTAAGTVTSFASRLGFAVSDVRRIAAGRDQDTGTPALEFAPGDSSNIQFLLDERNVGVNYSLGGTTLNGLTIDEVYDTSVSYVGALSRSAKEDARLFRDREEQAALLQQSVSGVNLDEEFANLITTQRAFEAAARMVQVGGQLFDEIIALLG